MASTLGKRKRKAPKHTKDTQENPSDETEALQNAQEIFRRHFEAQFKPLPVVERAVEVVEESMDGSEEETDWEGISDDKESAVQIVEHRDAQAQTAAMSREELKVFLSSKIPKNTSPIQLIQDKKIAEDDPTEAANLKTDLALQRLLAKSHLLDSATNPTVSGKNRHKATDLRMQALGAKTSLLTQAKMPMSHRRGIVGKQKEKEEKRRREARENGIILEKAKIKEKKTVKRDRVMGNPGLGKFSGGTLRLSKRDIVKIEGPKKRVGGGGKKRRK